MKILHLLSSDDQYGSAQCFLELLVRETNNYKIEPVVVTPKKNKINEKCDELNIKNYVVNYGQVQIPKHNKLFIFILKYFYNMFLYYKNKKQAINKLVSIVEKNDVNLIHTNSCTIDIGYYVANKTNLKNVWHLREFGKQDFNFYSVNFNYINCMNNDANIFISVSDSVKNAWVKRGLNSLKITTIYDGIDSTKFINVKEQYKEENKISMMMCGSFCNAKNQRLLIEAIKKLDKEYRNKIKVDFYGKKEGKYYADLEKVVNKFKLNDVVFFKGYVNNIPQILEKYNIGILCSKSEAFGRVTVEYMMAKLCTVVPNSGANLELINDSCGMIYESNNVESLVDVLNKIIKSEIDIYKLGDEAHKNAVNKFDINKNIREIIAQFKKYSQ